MKSIKARIIENALCQRFPGWNGSYYEDSEGWHIETTSKLDFYHLYPGLSKEQADKQIVQDTMEIINQFMPGATLKGYEQHGKYIKV